MDDRHCLKSSAIGAELAVEKLKLTWFVIPPISLIHAAVLAPAFPEPVSLVLEPAPDIAVSHVRVPLVSMRPMSHSVQRSANKCSLVI